MHNWVLGIWHIYSDICFEEYMDAEYKLLNKKSLLDGIAGCLIGIPIALLTGLVISLICK